MKIVYGIMIEQGRERLAAHPNGEMYRCVPPTDYGFCFENNDRITADTRNRLEEMARSMRVETLNTSIDWGEL